MIRRRSEVFFFFPIDSLLPVTFTVTAEGHRSETAGFISFSFPPCHGRLEDVISPLSHSDTVPDKERKIGKKSPLLWVCAVRGIYELLKVAF